MIVIFPLARGNKSKAAATDMLDSSNSNTPDSFASSKKSSIDEGLLCSTTRARRSPLRFLGNFVDDKILRGRWGSTKRAKSSVELGRLAWEIPDDLADTTSIDSKHSSARKNSSNTSNDDFTKKERNSSRRLTINEPNDIKLKDNKRQTRSMSTSSGERTRNRIPSAASDRLSLSSCSAIGSDDADIFFPQHSSQRTEISADALAEIEV